MTTRDFCYWLQGFFEVSDTKDINAKQTEIIQRHLNLVFVHDIDPSMGDKDHQDKLNAVHNNKSTLQELGDKYSFVVTDSRHGPCPHKGWKLSSLHGWYDPEHGVPRC